MDLKFKNKKKNKKNSFFLSFFLFFFFFFLFFFWVKVPFLVQIGNEGCAKNVLEEAHEALN